MISPGWSSFSDVQPTPNAFKIMQEAPGAIGTGHFGHYAGTGAKTTMKGGYGVGVVYNVAIDPNKIVTLTADWAQYSVAFADAGMGMLPGGGAAKVTNKIQELLWITPDADWDFSLDEIRFYKGTPPTGPAGGGDAGQ
jgi:hypothetical protein